MTDLKAIQEELERQDREFAKAFEQLRAKGNEVTILVANEALEALEETARPRNVMPIGWALRG